MNLLRLATCALGALLATSATGESTEPARGWDITAAIRASGGYRENVALSAVNPIDRAFARGEAEVFVLRPLNEQWKFLSFVNGEVLRYVSPPADVAGEQEWIGQAELRWEPGPAWRISTRAVGFLQDTFIDPSLTEGEQATPVWVRMAGAYATFAPRVRLGLGFTLEPSWQAKRIHYRRNYTGDYESSRPGLRLEWSRSERLVVSATAYEHHRRYSKLTSSRADGRPLPGQLLRLRQREAELRAATRFRAAGEWTLSAVAGRLENRDHAFGFLDYDQDRAALEIEWERADSRLLVTGDRRHWEYRVQSAGTGLVRTPRTTRTVELTARAEHSLTEHWALFAEYRRERNRSNVTDPFFGDLFSYRTSMAFAGIERTF